MLKFYTPRDFKKNRKLNPTSRRKKTKQKKKKKLRRVGQRTETIGRILENGLTFAVIVLLGGINKISKGEKERSNGWGF